MDAQQTRSFPSSMSSDSSSDRSKTIHEQANEAMRQVAEAARQAQSQAKDAMAAASTQATGTVKGVLNHQVNTGADFAGTIAHSINSAADDLSRNAPQLAELARGAARQMDAFADQIREKSVDELFQDASDFARRQPGVVFGAAAVLGFALFRMFKVASPNLDVGSGGYSGFEAGRRQRPQAGRTEEARQNRGFEEPEEAQRGPN
jgi:hypothetical protein